MKAFFDMIHRPPLKILLFGDVCTSVTDPIAKASKRWNIVQLSYGDTHPMYSKANFPNLFRIVPSENEFNAPRLELMKVYNWTRVGTLYQNMPLYSLAHNRLVNDLEESGVEVKAAQSFADEVGSAVARLKDSGVRIILGNFNETWARKVFCEVGWQNFQLSFRES
jgi:gamma-aminobutyric acid type B receptor